MFVGHLAVGLAAKRVQPKIPLGVLVAASFGIDLVWPLLVLAGVEVVRVDPPAAELYGGCRSGAVDMALAVLGAVDRAAQELKRRRKISLDWRSLVDWGWDGG